MLNAQAYIWFAKVVTDSELLVGIGLIIAAFVSIAAFFGALMDFSFILARSASTNPLLIVIGVGLILAWKVGGYIGGDYLLLKWIGTPWDATPKNKTMETVPVKQPASAD